MTAGSGIYHSERNQNDSPLRFLQIWITPRARRLTPSYGGFDGTTEAAREARRNKLSWLVSDAASSRPAPVKIQQDANIFVSELDPSREASFSLRPDRQAYLVCVEGSVEVGPSASPSGEDGGSAITTSSLEMHDAAELTGAGELKLTAAAQGAHVLLIEMAAGPGGRQDL